MQLLIDSTQETPASLRFIAATLCALADTYGPSLDDLLASPKPDPQPASINGPSTPIVLHAHGPAAPIDARPQAYSDSFIPKDLTQLDPAQVFGRGVPAGTIPLAPPAPNALSATNVVPILSSAGSPASAPPAPMTTQSDALLATTTAGTIAPAAPVAANIPTTPDTAAVATASDQRDKDGLPWDARVHSETRKMNADGTWRNRRNLDANVKAAVMQELLARYGNGRAHVLTPQLPLAPPPPAPEAPPAPVAPQPPTAAVPVPDGVPLGLPNTGQPATVPALGFRDFMSAVNKALTANTLTQAQLTQACQAVNLDGITALASEPGKISLVHSQIAHMLGAPAA